MGVTVKEVKIKWQNTEKYLEARSKIDRERHYDPDEAFKLLKETATISFDETVELSVG